MSGKKAAMTAAWTTPDGQVITEDDAARLAQVFGLFEGRCLWSFLGPFLHSFWDVGLSPESSCKP